MAKADVATMHVSGIIMTMSMDMNRKIRMETYMKLSMERGNKPRAC